MKTMAQYLVKRFSDIFGKLKITPSKDLLWFEATQKQNSGNDTRT